MSTGGFIMTTILDVDMTVWKRKVYDKLTEDEVKELKEIMQKAVQDAGFVTGKLYLLPDEPITD
jgi:hypothetical protein